MKFRAGIVTAGLTPRPKGRQRSLKEPPTLLRSPLPPGSALSAPPEERPSVSEEVVFISAAVWVSPQLPQTHGSPSRNSGLGAGEGTGQCTVQAEHSKERCCCCRLHEVCAQPPPGDSWRGVRRPTGAPTFDSTSQAGTAALHTCQLASARLFDVASESAPQFPPHRLPGPVATPAISVRNKPSVVTEQESWRSTVDSTALRNTDGVPRHRYQPPFPSPCPISVCLQL